MSRASDDSPFQRVLALANAARTPAARAIMRDIRGRLAAGESHVPWVRAAQLARDLDVISEDAALYLVEIFTEEAAARFIDEDPELRDLTARMKRVEDEHGLGEDEAFLVGQGPPEWEALNRRWNARFDQFHAGLLESLDEPAAAAEMRRHRERYSQRTAAGWEEMIGEDAG